MGLRIFESDPDAKPVPKPDKVEYERPAISLRTGMQRNKKAVALPTWRFTSEELPESAALAELFGGKAEEFDPTKAQPFHVITETDELEVVIDGSAAVEDKLIQWGVGGPLHECDGMFSLLPDDKGEPCGCPSTMEERKALSRKRPPKGPAPSINVTFTLAGKGEDLGKIKLISTAWTLAEVIHEVKDALDAVDGPALCTLKLELVEYISDKYGPVSYRKPVIVVQGSYSDAIAEDR